MLADFHIHTKFSSDSTAEPHDIVITALSRNMSAICFTDHNDFDWPDEDKTLFNLDFEAYTDYMNDFRSTCSDKLPIYIGVEQGLSVPAASRIDNYDPEHKLDFIIGSSHIINGKDPYEKEFWIGTDIKKAIDEYYECIINNINACSNYDVYGHFDYITRYIPDKKYPYSISSHMDIIEVILKMLIEKGKGIELNTAGLKHTFQQTNPSLPVLSLYRQLGGEIITVGSDAHTAPDTAFYHKTAEKLLHDAGFRYYTVFKKRKPVFITL